ncbi:MAG: hypothetical protein VX293_10930 [Candidatus Latescibacterota bacterium]|nr:hypothetical protein [Candidatus Latescibacterota bacterium]
MATGLVMELLGITHAECGGERAVHWDLPPEVRTAIASYHHPARTSQHRRLAAMVRTSPTSRCAPWRSAMPATI